MSPTTTPSRANLTASFALSIGILAVLPSLAIVGLSIYRDILIFHQAYANIADLRFYNDLSFLFTVIAIALGIVAIILGSVGWNTARRSGLGLVSSVIGLTLGIVVLAEKGATLIYLFFLIANHLLSFP